MLFNKWCNCIANFRHQTASIILFVCLFVCLLFYLSKQMKMYLCDWSIYAVYIVR